MAAETFARLLFGFLFQVIPFGILAMYPFWNRLRTSPKKTTALIALAVAGVGTVFATAGCYLQGLLPGDATLFNAVNAIFLACLVPCLALYLVLVRGTWQEKLFVFDFALTCAWGITATTDIVFTVTHKDGPFDGLPYQGWTPLLLLALGAVTVPVLMLLLKRNYLPVRDGISWKQSTVLALLSAALFIMLASIFVATAFTDAANPLTMTLFVAVLAMVFAVYAAMLALLRAGAERLDAQRKGDRAEPMLQLQSRQIKAMDDARRHDRRMRSRQSAASSPKAIPMPHSSFWTNTWTAWRATASRATAETRQSTPWQATMRKSLRKTGSVSRCTPPSEAARPQGTRICASFWATCSTMPSSQRRTETASNPVG